MSVLHLVALVAFWWLSSVSMASDLASAFSSLPSSWKVIVFTPGAFNCVQVGQLTPWNHQKLHLSTSRWSWALLLFSSSLACFQLLFLHSWSLAERCSNRLKQPPTELFLWRSPVPSRAFSVSQRQRSSPQQLWRWWNLSSIGATSRYQACICIYIVVDLVKYLFVTSL